MKLNHNNFGQGTVISEENGKITIEFNEFTKVLLVAFANLTNEDGTPYYVAPVVEKKQYKAVKSVKKQLTSEEKRECSFLNPDGSTNWEAKNNWLEQREIKRRNVISW